MRGYFPNTVSYNRFVELQQKAMLVLAVFVKTQCLSQCNGISFIDSTKVAVCNNKRIRRNKVFKEISEVGKSTMGWFYGFKLNIASTIKASCSISSPRPEMLMIKSRLRMKDF
jgi:hypothetical protein